MKRDFQLNNLVLMLGNIISLKDNLFLSFKTEICLYLKLIMLFSFNLESLIFRVFEVVTIGNVVTYGAAKAINENGFFIFLMSLHCGSVNGWCDCTSACHQVSREGSHWGQRGGRERGGRGAESRGKFTLISTPQLPTSFNGSSLLST